MRYCFFVPQGTTSDFFVPHGTTSDFFVPQGTASDFFVPQGTASDFFVPQGTASDDLIIISFTMLRTVTQTVIFLDKQSSLIVSSGFSAYFVRELHFFYLEHNFQFVVEF